MDAEARTKKKREVIEETITTNNGKTWNIISYEALSKPTDTYNVLSYSIITEIGTSASAFSRKHKKWDVEVQQGHRRAICHVCRTNEGLPQCQFDRH